MICYEGKGLPPEVQENPCEWFQDPDVLDTWFSSSLWPLSALGWPHQTDEIERFYPNSVLVTGHDILFFWVARMIMIGEYITEKVPFAEASLQGLIFGKSHWKEGKDGAIIYLVDQKEGDGIHSKWEKMSKSKGNVIDPIEMITIFGADAVRMSLSASATHSPQIDIDKRRFKEFKNFINKIWNGSRFVLIHLTITSGELMEGLGELELEDRWILSSLNEAVDEIRKDLAGYRFDQVAMKSYTFFWDRFCAYYVEIAKPALFGKRKGSKNKQKILTIVLLAALRLIHPIAPFITEEIFQLLKQKFPQLKRSAKDPYTEEAIQALLAPACIVCPYPATIQGIFPVAGDGSAENAKKTFAIIDQMIYTIRNIRAEMQLSPSTPTDVIIEGNTSVMKQHQHIIVALVPIKTLIFNPIKKDKGLHSAAFVCDLKVIVPLPQELAEREKNRLAKERDKLEQHIFLLKNQLSNQNFIEKAPQALVEQRQQELREAQQKFSAYTNRLK